MPPSSLASEELRAARDRLITVLFFRGQLADSIMEAGLQDRLVDTAGRQTHSEVRLALLDWIYNNPDKAANLYFYLKDRKPGEKLSPGSISYALPTWELRKNFLALAGAVDRAAADASIGEEEMSLVAQRLFGSAQAPPEDYAPLIPGAAGTPGVRGAGDEAAVRYADYQLNPERVERERQALGKWFENVKALWESALLSEVPGERAGSEKGGMRDKSADMGQIRRLLEETFLRYRNFIVFLSNLKGLKRISGTEAVRLEEVRRAFRRNLCELEALAAKRRLDELADGLPDGAPGSTVLRAEALGLRKAIEAFLADLGANPESVKYSGRRLYDLGNAVDFWTFRFLMHGRLLRLKAAIGSGGFSCVWDKLIFGYLSRFFPSADYVRIAAALSARGKTINAALESVAAGDGASASFFAGGGRTLLEQIAEAEDAAVRQRKYSGLNRRLQFIFWDALVNPFGLSPGPKGISAGIKL